ncbi:MAG: GNAT family N-acetyltransferase [Pseudolysinimonas sp.]
MTPFTIEELPIPETLASPAGADFIAAVAVRNAAEVRGYGTPEVAYPPEEIFSIWQDAHEPKRWWGARVDGDLVARALIEWQLDDEERVGWVTVQVHPDHEGQGIGRALLEAMEAAARADGFRRMITYAVSPDAPGERLVPPTGAGSVPVDNREVRFLLAAGFRLEQVTRASRVALPADTADLNARRDAAAAAAGGYRVHLWTGATPERWLEDQATLYTRMSTEEPTAGLEQPEDPWDVQRVIDYDALAVASPRAIMTAAAEHIASGRLAAFTQLSVPHDPTRPVTQEDTLVLREHRGHRLGMLLKVENLLALERDAPGRPSVLTWNACENRPMLDVNDAVGFEPIGYEGAWRKDL